MPGDSACIKPQTACITVALLLCIRYTTAHEDKLQSYWHSSVLDMISCNDFDSKVLQRQTYCAMKGQCRMQSDKFQLTCQLLLECQIMKQHAQWLTVQEPD